MLQYDSGILFFSVAMVQCVFSELYLLCKFVPSVYICSEVVARRFYQSSPFLINALSIAYGVVENWQFVFSLVVQTTRGHS